MFEAHIKYIYYYRLLGFLIFAHDAVYGQNSMVQSKHERALNAVPLKITDVLPYTISIEHPFGRRGTIGLVYEKEFYSKNAGHIKLHFTNFDVGPDNYVEITAINIGTFIGYAAKGKIVDQDKNMVSDFWSQVLFDDRIIVRLYSKQVSNYYGFI